MSTPGPSSAKYRPSASAATSASTGQVAKADSSSSGSGFTAEMRDRQARGKDPYVKEADQDDEEEDDDEEEEDDEMMDDEEEEDEEDDDMDVDADDEDEESARDERGNRRLRLGRGPKPEPFEDREQRSFALSVLDNPEQLMMYAQSTGDSIPGQRRRFMAILCGFATFSDPSGKTSARRR